MPRLFSVVALPAKRTQKKPAPEDFFWRWFLILWPLVCLAMLLAARSALLPIAADERVRGTVVMQIAAAGKFGNDALGQHLAKLHAPLIERIDVPDGALREDFVLVQSDKLAQRFGRQALGQDGIGRAVALKGTLRHLEIGHAIGLHFLGGLAKGQRLSLGKEVRHQQIVVIA